MSSIASHSKRRQRRHRNNNRTFLYWMIGASVVVVIALVAVFSRANQGVPTPANAVASQPLDESTLLPLADPVSPIHGFHDMPRIPRGPIPTRAVEPGAPQANVDLPLTYWDWGLIPRRPPVQQTFPIQNTGTEPLLITKVVTSCGCTTADLSASIIPPGKRADLVVTFDPDYHKDAVGPVTRIVWLETNDPDMPLIEIRADANVMAN